MTVARLGNDEELQTLISYCLGESSMKLHGKCHDRSYHGFKCSIGSREHDPHISWRFNLIYSPIFSSDVYNASHF